MFLRIHSGTGSTCRRPHLITYFGWMDLFNITPSLVPIFRILSTNFSLFTILVNLISMLLNVFLVTSKLKNDQQRDGVADMIRCGILLSALENECTGGEVKGYIFHLSKSNIGEVEPARPVLQLYMIYFDILGREDKVLLVLKEKHLTLLSCSDIGAHFGCWEFGTAT
ncbi:hypothetical protein OROMI_006470 [Orobanche minor]